MGCDMTIINKNLYNRLCDQELDCLELPIHHMNLGSTLNARSQRIRKRVLMEMIIGDTIRSNCIPV